MKTYKYKKVDAFTSHGSRGNPAAFLELGSDCLSEPEMLRIAIDHKGFVSEVVYCEKSTIADMKLTYFSSECEVSFCGHGTIAAMYEIIRNDPLLLSKPEISIETRRKGVLIVYNRIEDEDAVYITSPEATWSDLPASAGEIADALSIKEVELAKDFPLDFIDAGLRTLIVPVKNLEIETAIQPNQENLREFCEKNSIDIVLIFSREVKNQDCTAHTRVFAPRFGYLEDPATGSGNSAFGNYLIRNQIWKDGMIKVEQGSKQMLFNEIRLLKKESSVLFGGKATTRIEGKYFLD